MTDIQPIMTAKPIGGGLSHVRAAATLPIGGMWTEVTAELLIRADVELQPRITNVDGAVALELVNVAGDVVARTIHSVPRPAEPEPWPRTQAIPPSVWTDLVHGTGSVFNETGATAMVTVDEDGEVTFGAPMRWRPADDQEADYDGWVGDDI